MRKRVVQQKSNFRRKKNQPKSHGQSFVLDFYPHGKSLSRKSPDDFNPLAVVVTVKWFQFFDVVLKKGTLLNTLDKLQLSPRNASIIRMREISYEKLSDSATDILPEVISNIVKNSEKRFIKFLNTAQPLTTQMHQLRLLPGIGNKRMWVIIEARKKSPFSSYSDFSSRTGISDPISLISNRILQELRETPKYHLFTKKGFND